MAIDFKKLFGIAKFGSKDLSEVLGYSELLNSYIPANNHEAKTLTAYSRGVQAIAEAVAQARFEIFEEKNGYDFRKKDDPINYLLNVAPNSYQNAYDFWRSAMEIVLYHGNCFIGVDRNQDGQPVALHINRISFKPQALLTDVSTNSVPNRQLFWMFTDNVENAVPDRDVIHLKISGSSGDLLGEDPIQQFAKTITLSGNSEEFANNIYEKNGNISVVLKTDKALKPDQIQKLRDSWATRYGGRNGEATVLLEEGMDIKPIQITPDQAKFLENRKFQIQEVARILGVPTPILMDYSDYNYNTAETADLDFYKRAVSPKIDMMEKELMRKLLTERSIKRGKSVKADVRPLFRADMETRMKYLQDRFSVGSITPNQIRVSEGDEPIEGNPAMDKTYIMSNLAPSDKIESFYDKEENNNEAPPIEEES